MRKLFVLLATVGAVLIGLVGVSLAQAGDKDNDFEAKAKLTGYEETPLTLSSPGHGSFKADLDSEQDRVHASVGGSPDRRAQSRTSTSVSAR